jgi:hypothetical protein
MTNDLLSHLYHEIVCTLFRAITPLQEQLLANSCGLIQIAAVATTALISVSLISVSSLEHSKVLSSFLQHETKAIN